MKISWIRAGKRVLGISIHWRNARSIALRSETYRRTTLCDGCAAPAMMFCRTHSLYLCDTCIDLHQTIWKDPAVRHLYLSLAALEGVRTQ